MSDLWTDIETDSDSIFDFSIDEILKDQENLDYKEQEGLSDPYRKLSWIRRGDQRALEQLKSEIKSSKDKLFFKHTSAGSTQVKWYSIQANMDQ